MSSPTWSVYEGEWGGVCNEDAGNVPPELALKGCGLRQKCLLQRGAQGAVYLGEDADGNLFAVKRLFTQRGEFGIRGISESALREATLLTHITEKAEALDFVGDFGVVALRGIVEAPFQELCLIMDMYPLDLSMMFLHRGRRVCSGIPSSSKTLVRCPVLSTTNVIRYLLRGILEILQFLHEECRVIHRDVKLGNLLVGEDGRIRLTDFGSARLMHDEVEKVPETKSGGYTPLSIRTTVIYQAPECLLGERSYTSAVDIWAAGVVFAELLLQQHLFRGCSELMILSEIWKLLGTPSEDSSSFLSGTAITYAVRTEPTIALRFPESVVCADGLNLLQLMLSIDPRRRITAAEALRHPFLTGGGFDEGRALWRRKVEECAQEAAAQQRMGMGAFYESSDKDGSDDEDDDGEDGCWGQACRFNGIRMF